MLKGTYGVTATYTDPAVGGGTPITITCGRGKSSRKQDDNVSGVQCEVIEREYFIPYQSVLTSTPRKGGKIVDESANWWIDSIEADSAQSHWKCQTFRYIANALGVE